jgi:hypothetical protein
MFCANKSSKIGRASCDSGLANAQTLFNFAKTLTKQPATTFAASATEFGLCTLDAQDSIVSVAEQNTWAKALGSKAENVITVNNLAAYTTDRVDNRLYPEGGSPDGGGPDGGDCFECSSILSASMPSVFTYAVLVCAARWMVRA